MIRYQEEARKGKDGGLPKALWTKAKRATDGFADDVINEKLLNKYEVED